jgi:hypothetical protein
LERNPRGRPTEEASLEEMNLTVKEAPAPRWREIIINCHGCEFTTDSTLESVKHEKLTGHRERGFKYVDSAPGQQSLAPANELMDLVREMANSSIGSTEVKEPSPEFPPLESDLKNE